MGSTIEYIGKLERRTHEIEKLPDYIDEIKF